MTTTAPTSSAAFPSNPDHLSGPRDLAALQRDTLALLRQHPRIFIVLPAVLFFPFDFANEYISGLMGGDDGLEGARAYLRISRWIELVVGTLVAAAMLEGVRIAARGDTPRLAAVMSQALQTWGRALRTTFVTGLIVGLCMLLLIVPGLIVGTRFMLAVPASVLDGLDGEKARRRSAELVADRGALRLFAWAFAATVSWYVLGMFSSMLLSLAPVILGIEGLLATLISTVGAAFVNVVAAALVVAAGLLYWELAGQRALWPVGVDLVTGDGHRIPPPAGSGQRGLAVVGALAGLCLLPLIPLVTFGVWSLAAPEQAAAFLDDRPALLEAVSAIFPDDEDVP